MTSRLRLAATCWPSLAFVAGVAGVVGLTADATRADESIESSQAAVQKPAGLQTRDPDSLAVMDFEKRVQDYVALHKMVEGMAPRLPQDATPQQIDDALQQLSQGITKARAGARPGDVFVPAMQERIRQTLKKAFSEGDGKDLRASILDENPIGAPVSVNGPYPDEIPLTSMPPKVIAVLPKLPEELEFRFIGDRLILFDHHAHLIVDYVDRALPVR